MTDMTPAELLQRAKAVLAACADNMEYHQAGCPQCNMGGVKCDTARYWSEAAERAEQWVERRQQEARRAAILAAH